MTAIRQLLAFGIALGMVTAANAQTKLLRFPDVHGKRVVFAYAGDLWMLLPIGLGVFVGALLFLGGNSI